MAAPALARRLTVILYADVEGDSRLVEREEEGT
jgi:class 3 adenylate cyclase